jgi:hypothetical protein
MLGALKRFVISSQLSDWTDVDVLEDGYTIILPTPMDLPFMLRLGLEGLRCINTDDCRQILIVPDGWGDDCGAGLRQVADEFDDPRIELVELTRRDYRLIRSMRPPGSAATHWMQVVNGTRHARCKYAFLHDADAFFLEADGLQRQYNIARERAMHTLGVTARWDPFFVDNGYEIPGTWELMYSVAWARSRHPYELKGRRMATRYGRHTFDSMLYPQFLDYPSGRIGVMPSPPEFVHFSGTIFSYRTFRDCGSRQVTDELFRVLLLAVVETALDVPTERRVLPAVEKLADGLCNSNAVVQYQSAINRRGYAEYRQQVEQMCSSPVFLGKRSDVVRALLRTFDAHFHYDPKAPCQRALDNGEMLVVGVR